MRWPIVDRPITPEEFDQRLFEAGNAQLRQTALKQAMQSFGYDTYVFGASLSRTSAAPHQILLSSNMDEDWLSEYEAEGYAANDVAVIYCMTNSTPLLWSVMREREVRGDFGADALRVSDLAISWGYLVGVTIPLSMSWSFQKFGIGLCRRGSKDFGGHDAMFREHGDRIIVLARLFLTYFDFTEAFKRQFHLAPKEWEFLTHSFDMKNTAQIADAMGIKLGTARGYRKHIMMALDVSSFSEAQFKVLAMGALPRPKVPELDSKS